MASFLLRVQQFDEAVTPVGIDAGDTHDAGDPALMTAPGDEDDEVNGLRDQASRHRDHGFLDELFDAGQRRCGTVGVDGGDSAGVAGVPGLEHIERFGAPDLADDDAVGPQTQRGADEVGHANDPGPRPERHRVRGRALQLPRVFDQDDAFVMPRDFAKQCIGERGLSRAGAPAMRILCRSATAARIRPAAAPVIRPSRT